MANVFSGQIGIGEDLGKLAVPRSMSLVENLRQQQEMAEANVARLKRLQELLAKNPEIEEVLNLLGRNY